MNEFRNEVLDKAIKNINKDLEHLILLKKPDLLTEEFISIEKYVNNLDKEFTKYINQQKASLNRGLRVRFASSDDEGTLNIGEGYQDISYTYEKVQYDITSKILRKLANYILRDNSLRHLHVEPNMIVVALENSSSHNYRLGVPLRVVATANDSCVCRDVFSSREGNHLQYSEAIPWTTFINNLENNDTNLFQNKINELDQKVQDYINTVEFIKFLYKKRIEWLKLNNVTTFDNVSYKITSLLDTFESDKLTPEKKIDLIKETLLS